MRFGEGSGEACRWGWSSLRTFLNRAFGGAPFPRGIDPKSGGRVDLEAVAADLKSLNGRTEQDFLGIGEKLAEFMAIARRLSSDMQALSELADGKDGCQASQVLAQVLNRLRLVEAQAEAGDRKLADLCGSARQVGCAFAGFANTVSVFRVLASMTRIEASRLGQAGGEFNDLAEEVRSLAESIESRGRGVLEAALVLHHKMQLALARITSLHAHELKELPAIVEGVLEGLGSFEDRQRRAGEASLRGAADYQDVSAAIADLITAIQFHDITRQQVEHVADALQQLDGGDARPDSSRSATAPDHHAALSLQCSQLSNAAQVFAASVDRMERDLERIGERVSRMAESGKTLMGLSEDEQDSFFLQMEGRFTGILKIAGRCAEVEIETRATLAELEGAVRRIEEPVTEAQQIGIRIHRIAINAAIRAEQFGQEGHSLAVVAESIERLALDTNGVTGEAAGVLNSIREAARGWSSGLALLPAGETPGGGDVCVAMRAAILGLHSASEEAFSRVHQIAALGGRLSLAIRSARAGFSAGTLFAAVVEGARATLEGLAGPPVGAAVKDDPVAMEPGLKQFAARYTMQAERDVHASVAVGASPVPAFASAANASEEDLGENVELF